MKLTIVKFKNDTYGVRRGGKWVECYRFLVGINTNGFHWVYESDISRAQIPTYEQAQDLVERYNNYIEVDYGTPV